MQAGNLFYSSGKYRILCTDLLTPAKFWENSNKAQALLSFNAYSHSEFGKVKSVIDFISMQPSDNGYPTLFKTPKGLKQIIIKN